MEGFHRFLDTDRTGWPSSIVIRFYCSTKTFSISWAPIEVSKAAKQQGRKNKADPITGGGLWNPPSNALNLIRRSIDKHPERIKSVITDKEFVAEFFGSSKGSKGSEKKDERDEESIVSLFVDKNGADALKTAPRASLTLLLYAPKVEGNQRILKDTVPAAEA
jgi:hypothetical protein